MACSMPTTPPFRTMPRQGMRKWLVVRDVDGHVVTVAEFHGYPQARAEADRLNAAATQDAGYADAREKVPA